MRFLVLVPSIAVLVLVLVLDRKSIDIESFVDKDWIGYLRPCEYEHGQLYRNDPCQWAQPRLSSMKTDD